MAGSMMVLDAGVLVGGECQLVDTAGSANTASTTWQQVVLSAETL